MTPIAYARITEITASPDAVDDVVAVYGRRSPAHVAATPGLRTMFGLVHRSSRRVTGVTVWTSMADRDRRIAERVGTDVDLSSYAPFMDGGFTHDAYDVTFDTLPPADPAQPFAPAVARVTMNDFVPDGWDAGIAGLRALVTGNRDQAAISGTILCENHRMRRAVVIELAPTIRELDDRVSWMQEHDQAARRGGYLRTRPERRVCDVIAHY